MANNDDFGEFEEVIDESVQNPSGQINPEQQQSRVKLPRGNEKIGIIVQRYGGNRMEVKSSDGKSRNCRVPGRFKRDFWLRPKDIVLIAPWVDDDEKGDIVFKYNSGQVNQLRKKGLLNNLNDDF
jgi:translation initiation factor 1A